MKKIYLLIILVIVIVLSTTSTRASASPTNLLGWAWSSTIGWISLSSDNADAGTGGTYHVTLATTTGSEVGTFGGYAWSPNIGWISFNQPDVADCQDGTRAQVNLTNGNVTGWIKAIAGSGRTDGWDGCIHISGTNHDTGYTDGTKGITYNPATGVFNGYAWGDVNVGWLTFGTQYNAGNEVHCPNCVGGGNASCSFGNSSVDQGGTVTLNWSISNDTATYTLKRNGTIINSNISPSSTGTNDQPGAGTYTYTLTGGAQCSSNQIIVADQNNQPGINMWFKNQSGNDTKSLTSLKIRTGQEAVIKWEGNGVSFDTNSCNAILTNQTNDEESSPNLQNGITTLTNIPVGVYKYRMYCLSDDGNETKINAKSSSGNNYLDLIVTNSVIEEF